jgi:hypothetical protein
MYENKSIVRVNLDKNYYVYRFIVLSFVIWNQDRIIMALWKIGCDIPLALMPS